MASTARWALLVLLPCATAFVTPSFSPFRSTLDSLRTGRVGFQPTFLSSRQTRAVRVSSVPRMSATFDYDVVIVGCGVGGHGAALHARGQVRRIPVT
jgi:dihydrolipoamide dehydrogenase